MKLFNKGALPALVCGLTLMAPVPSLAALITGSQLNINGAGVVGATFLNFQCNLPGDTVCAAPPANTGDFSVNNSSLSFAQYNGTFGLIKSINNADQPLNALFLLANFMIFDLNNNITIDLTFIPLGTDPVSSLGCTDQPIHCTPRDPALATPANPQGLSAFNLDRNATGTAAVFGVYGVAHDNTDGTTANIAGTLTSQFTGDDPAAALARALAGSNRTYSSNLTLTVVPEPSALVLGGLGLIGLSVFRFRKRV